MVYGLVFMVGFRIWNFTAENGRALSFAEICDFA